MDRRCHRKTPARERGGKGFQQAATVAAFTVTRNRMARVSPRERRTATAIAAPAFPTAQTKYGAFPLPTDVAIAATRRRHSRWSAPAGATNQRHETGNDAGESTSTQRLTVRAETTKPENHTCYAHIQSHKPAMLCRQHQKGQEAHWKRWVAHCESKYRTPALRAAWDPSSSTPHVVWLRNESLLQEDFIAVTFLTMKPRSRLDPMARPESAMK